MAEKKNIGLQKEKITPSGKTEKESVYPAADLIKSAHRFHTREECVAAALSFYGKKEATIKETEGLIKKFLQREVK